MRNTKSKNSTNEQKAIHKDTSDTANMSNDAKQEPKSKRKNGAVLGKINDDPKKMKK